MGRKIKINRTLGLISVLTIFTGIIYGCYTREVAPEVKNIYGQTVKPRAFSDEELRQFAKTIRKVDGEAEAHYKMALYFQGRHRDKLAIDELKQVLKRDPACAKAYSAIGVSYDNLGDNDAAIEYYKLALQIDPKLDYVYNNLGYSYLLKNDMQDAVESFQQAIALNGKEKRYSNNLGLAYARQGKYELAFEQFKFQDSDANAEKMLAKVMKDLGKGAEVEAVLVAARNAPKAEVVVARANDSAEIMVESVLPEAAPESSEVAVAEVKPENANVVVAEVKAENPKEVITEVKPENPKVDVAEVKSETPIVVAEVNADIQKNPVIEVVPAAPQALQKHEEIRVAAVQPSNIQPESQPVIKEDVVAEVEPQTPKAVIAEIKTETPKVVVAEVKSETPKNPVVDIVPATPQALQKPEEIQVAAVQPSNNQPESKPVIKEDAVVEVKPETTKAVVAELKPEIPTVVVADVKLEKPQEAVAEVKTGTTKNPVIDSAPSVPLTPQKPAEIQIAAVQTLNVQTDSKPVINEAAVVEAKPEAPKAVVAEIKPEIPTVVVADVKQAKPQDVVAEVKQETPKAVVAEVKPETAKNPAIDIASPAIPAQQKPEETRIAVVKPLMNAKPDSKLVIAENVKSAPDSVLAISHHSEKDNPAQGLSTIQVHEVRVLGASTSIQTGGSQVAYDKAASRQIEIAVENGNGVKGAAGRMAELLRKKGFKVVKVSDAKSFDHYSTKVFYEADDFKEVQQLLRVIPESPYSAELYKMDKMGPPPIRLLVGKDQVKKETALARGKKPAAPKATSVANMNKAINPKKKKA